MAERITVAHLRLLAARINKMTGSPTAYMDANRNILVGHYHVSGEYGGWSFHRTVNTSGGVTCPISMGVLPARELYERMHAYMRGFEAGLEMQSQAREVISYSLAEIKQGTGWAKDTRFCVVQS